MKYYSKALEMLKTNYKHLGLSKILLETQAKKIARRVGEDESKLEDEVADVEDDLRLFQSFEDKIRTLGNKEPEKGSGEPEPTPAGGTGEPEPTPEEIEKQPKWVRDMMEAQKGILEKFANMEKQEVQKTASQSLIALLTEKGVSKEYYEPFIHGREFENNPEKLEEFAEMLKTSESNYISSNKLQKLSDVSDVKRPSVFGKAPEGGKDGDLNEAELLFLKNQAPEKTN